MLAEVQVLVLVTKNRHAGLGRFGVASHQFRDLVGLGVLVRQGQQRHLHADQFAHIGAPEAGAGHHDVGLDDALSVATPVTRPPVCSIPMTLVEPRKTAPRDSARRVSATQRGTPWRAVGLDVQTAENTRTVDQRMQFGAFGRVDDRSFDAPGRGPTLLTMQIGQPLLGGCHLEAAELVEAPLAVHFEAHELLDRVSGEFGHRLGGIGLEHQTRCVRGGSTRERERPLIQHGDAIPTACGELVGHVGTDYAGADDDNSR